MTFRLVTADDVCTAMAAVFTDQVGDLITALGLDDPEVLPAGRKPFKAPTTWTQVPTLEALQSATFPAGAITSPGWVGEPVKSSTGWSATWLIRAGVFDRDGDYNETANRVRTWAALLRGLALRNPSLGGLASSLRPVGESYRQLPQPSAARTIGGCSVDFRVTVDNIADLSDLDGPDPLVDSTHPTVTVRPY